MSHAGAGRRVIEPPRFGGIVVERVMVRRSVRGFFRRAALIAAALGLLAALAVATTDPPHAAHEPHEHMHVHAVDSSRDQPERPAEQHAVHVDCAAHAAGCCAMSKCHPWVPNETQSFRLGKAEGASPPERGQGFSAFQPDVAVPPPRILPV